jgi:hypothetical protein
MREMACSYDHKILKNVQSPMIFIISLLQIYVTVYMTFIAYTINVNSIVNCATLTRFCHFEDLTIFDHHHRRVLPRHGRRHVRGYLARD